jgi:hypothetical protein
MTKSWTIRIVALVVSVVVLVVVAWVAMYPGDGDPKNIKYVLWKVGLYRMNLDAAADTMIGDADRGTLVIGKTKEELRKRFGYLLTPSEVSQYYRDGYNSYARSKDVLFIRNSPWMVVFDGDRATDLVLMKGY